MPTSPLLEHWRAHAASDAAAVLDDEGTHSYRSIDGRARRVASAVLSGTRSLEGKRVAILVSPGASWVECFLGVLLAGGCVVVLSPLHPASETTYFLDDAEVETILVSPALAGRVAAVRGTRRVMTTGELRIATSRVLPPEAEAEDPALQLYTSGTTGKPKGAVITHENLGMQQALLRDAWGWRAGDVLLHALPLHHLHGLGIALLTCLGAGAAARMLPEFDAARLWETMAEATVFMGVPTMYTKLFVAFDAAEAATQEAWARGARQLRLATSGSAALPVRLGERWKAVTGRYPLERFGMTEIGVGMTNPCDGERRPGTVGLPLPSVEARIVGEGLVDAPSGELWIRGPSVFTRYHHREEATLAAFAPAKGGGRAWFKTGDTVTRDDAGYFKILGRTSVDILKSGGYKLSALEIEEALREHPAIAEAAVVGVPDETWGDRVVACIIARSGRESECGEETVRAFCKERLAAYKVPKDVVLVTELPRTAIGKVMKPEVVRMLVANAAARGATDPSSRL